MCEFDKRVCSLASKQEYLKEGIGRKYVNLTKDLINLPIYFRKRKVHIREKVESEFLESVNNHPRTPRTMVGDVPRIL